MKIEAVAFYRYAGSMAHASNVSLAANPHTDKSAWQKAAAWEHGWLAAFYKEHAPEFKAQRERIGHNG